MKLGVFNLWTEMHHQSPAGDADLRSNTLETPWTALEAMPLPAKAAKPEKARRAPKKRRAVIVDEITAI